MIRLHCTKKLLARLPLDDSGRLRSSLPSHCGENDDDRESRISGWHANLIVLQRRQCVLFVHDATRFPVFVTALKKFDFAQLDERFADGYMNTLLKCGADDALMDQAHAALGPLVCDTACDRSVQGTMNRMAQEIAIQLEYDGLSVVDMLGYRIGAMLADRPCTAKGVKDCIWPARAMADFLRGHGL